MGHDTSRSTVATRKLQSLENFTVQSISGKRLPTDENYAAWQVAYRYFNDRLFGGKLPDCIITNSRRRRTLGYFRRHAFADKSGVVAHEISINPTHIVVHGDAEALSTLVHEMAHLWREEFGSANRNGSKGARGYHDRVWAGKMEDVGLMPSDTAKPGGKKTGFRVSHYIIEGGPFDLACRELLISHFQIPWADNPAHLAVHASATAGSTAEGELSPNNTRARFICRHCDQKAWAKFSAKLICGECHIPLISA